MPHRQLPALGRAWELDTASCVGLKWVTGTFLPEPSLRDSGGHSLLASAPEIGVLMGHRRAWAARGVCVATSAGTNAL